VVPAVVGYRKDKSPAILEDVGNRETADERAVGWRTNERSIRAVFLFFFRQTEYRFPGNNSSSDFSNIAANG
jgi:hypothetical protein